MEWTSTRRNASVRAAILALDLQLMPSGIFILTPTERELSEIFEMYANDATVADIIKSLNDKKVKTSKGIVNIFVRAIYLWDDKMTIILNGGGKPIEIDDILLDEIEENNADFECSSMVADAPPKKYLE